MIHPSTRLVFINPTIGYGVFATTFIPKGTITYVKDALEPEVTPEAFAGHPPLMQAVIEKYSYIDERGVRIISWDFGKYVNHCCQCNTMSTGYGFEIAIRDIREGEEITDEYGMFNIPEPMSLECSRSGCRGRVCRDDFDNFYRQWDASIYPALLAAGSVDQPLVPFVEKDTWQQVEAFFRDPSTYRTVFSLKYQGAATARNPDENLAGIR
ncbi:MAG: hypothetical protein RLY31_51 [Bacteroidota bacterium]|jgi:hypothetical protein